MRIPIVHCLAKAIYDNLAESPDEITFKRGDILTVLEQNTNGLEGWWLCALRGKQGIAPGNRLKLLAGMYEASSLYQVPPSHLDKESSPERWMRRSWADNNTDKVVTPRKVGDIYIYDQPHADSQDYDVPPSRYFPADIYDSPQKMNNSQNLQPEDLYDRPPSSRGHSPSNSNRGSNEPQDIYDVPPAHTQVLIVNAEHEVLPSNRSSTLSMLSSGSNVTSSSGVSSISIPESSNPSSICGSTRSSSELSPQDIYDYPPSNRIITKDDLNVNNKMRSLNLRGYSDYIEEDYDTPKSNVKILHNDGEYDSLPTKEHNMDDIYDRPLSNKLLPLNSKLKRLSPSPDREGHDVYDIPPQVTKDMSKSNSRNSLDDFDENKRLSDSSSASSRGSDIQCPFDELPLELQSAMDLLVKLQQDIQTAINRLHSFVSSTWRQKENLEPRLYDIKLACMGVKTNLQEFVDFAQGALANSTKAADKSLFRKLSKQLQPIQDSLQVMAKSLICLANWEISRLIEGMVPPDQDYLGQMVNATRHLPEEIRKLTSLVQGNGPLLFKRSRIDTTPSRIQNRALPPTPGSGGKPAITPKPKFNNSISATPDKSGSLLQERQLPTPPMAKRPLPVAPNNKSLTPSQVTRNSNIERVTPERDFSSKPRRLKSDCSENILDEEDYANDSADLLEEYDYVELQSSDIEEQKKYKQEIDKQKLSEKQQERIEQLETDMKQPVFRDMSGFKLTDKPTILEANDKQLLVFYSEQMESHCRTLANAVDAFFSCIEYNQPPKVFIAHSKFVVLGAHKLVYIGDTLHRNVLHGDVRNKIMHCANFLCDCLKMTVTSTKTAALQYPAVVAVQDMVDRVVEVSHAANELKLVVLQAAAL